MKENSDSFQGETLVGQSFKYPSATVTKLLTSFDNRYRDISSDILGATIVAYLPSWPVEFQHGESMYLSRLKFVLVVFDNYLFKGCPK